MASPCPVFDLNTNIMTELNIQNGAPKLLVHHVCKEKERRYIMRANVIIKENMKKIETKNESLKSRHDLSVHIVI